MLLGNEKALWLLFLIPAVLIPVCVWAFYQKGRMLKMFAAPEMLGKISAAVSIKKQILKAVLLIVAFASIVIALTEPKWNPRPKKIKRMGRDVCILLDTSRSMLAEDIKPSRLERSKIAISDLMEILSGDRIAIVTFAGNSTIKCPLTQDYAFARMALEEISTESTTRGGTLIGDAIRKAIDVVFDKGTTEFKDIILITDGEDQESFPAQAAEKAAEQGIRIIAIGLGDDDQGARIPITDDRGKKVFLTYNGKEVWSKVDGETLRQVAYATDGGKYLSVGPGTTLDLGQIYSMLIESAKKHQLESVTMMEYDEKFQIFLALGLVLIVCEMLTTERKKSV
ncbi:MAG: VWA domain-containing protein [Planctomycetes bacterium]|nr:VWA domain-containing protein [Planctomycetota bacterium]